MAKCQRYVKKGISCIHPAGYGLPDGFWKIVISSDEFRTYKSMESGFSNRFLTVFRNSADLAPSTTR